ncbi:MAG: TIGR03960 family B12-binding radical SAM protein, partial [candidate division NC10 bacterium]|nr:TIGR03960 family B12-binding radical SAM protein [candidate division NC10 bacterium]
METYREAILERILPRVMKPSRYLLEWNAIRKDPSRVRLKVALAFPDTYEIGMSHIGLKLLHQILSRKEEILVERAFAPWEDFRGLTLQEGIPLSSHESGIPLKAFDIVGFTLQYELSYTTILDMLDLAGIPLKGEDRAEMDPLVIAGGPCAFNPEPLVGFIDLFVIGDAEEAIQEIAETVMAWKEASGKRHQLLEALAKIEGCYVPAVWDGKTTIKKRTAMNWADVDYAAFPMPYMEIIHDRPSIEVMRGCLRSCRFCQAGYIYRPLRERSAEEIFRTALDAVRKTGYEELSLSSLSISDLSCLSDLLPPLAAELQREKASLSLPSMRVEGVTEGFVQEVGKTRKGGGLTIAPEAGSKRLRDVINKGWITDEQIFNAVKVASRGGWDSVKMYFMIGQPTEAFADLDALVELSAEALRIGRREGPRNFSVTASASCFVPKPHTPFQWVGQDPLDLLKEKQRYLKRKLRQVGVEFKWHQAESSFLEAVFSRGDRKLGRVLFKAHTLGCRFDGWTERLNFELWLRAFKEEGIDPGDYATRFFPLEEEPLPWEHIWVVDKKFLLRECRRALLAALTHECQTGPCRACGQVCLPSWREWAEKTGAFGQGFAVGCQMSGAGQEDREVQASTINPSPSAIR